MKFPDLDGFFKGASWKDKHGLARIVGTVEHYVVWRRKGCAVQVDHYKDFLDRFNRTASFDI